jgi:Ca2+-binding EF-hand superfamily protein
MGQIGSFPIPHKALVDFVLLPKEAIQSLWLSYNLLGEGWSMSLDQFICIFNEAQFLRDNYRFKEDELRSLFKMFDTDSNGLIDALETMTTFGLISGKH